MSKDAVNLPVGFEWSTIDLTNDIQANEVYELLRDNYVEDSDHTFRFDYPVDFLRWALCIPDFVPEWFVGVRVSKT